MQILQPEHGRVLLSVTKSHSQTRSGAVARTTVGPNTNRAQKTIKVAVLENKVRKYNINCYLYSENYYRESGLAGENYEASASFQSIGGRAAAPRRASWRHKP
jgi:hypothetical protein